MNPKKIYELVSKFKNEIDRLDDCRQSANNQGNFDEAEYFAGAINSYERAIVDLETLIENELSSYEMLVHEHRADKILSNYDAVGV